MGEERALSDNELAALAAVLTHEVALLRVIADAGIEPIASTEAKDARSRIIAEMSRRDCAFRGARETRQRRQMLHDRFAELRAKLREVRSVTGTRGPLADLASDVAEATGVHISRATLTAVYAPRVMDYDAPYIHSGPPVEPPLEVNENEIAALQKWADGILARNQ